MGIAAGMFLHSCRGRTRSSCESGFAGGPTPSHSTSCLYSGLLIQLAGWPLVLGSAWASVPVSLFGALLVWRTIREDLTLRLELDGYQGYAARTRFRLLPFVW